MVRISINGRSIETAEATTVLQAARKLGITIPTLCDHPSLPPEGNCRLCIVDVEGQTHPQSACTLRAADGMRVATETPRLVQTRRSILELLLSRYLDAGYAANDRDETEFTLWLKQYHVELPKAFLPAEPRYAVDSDPNPFVSVDLNKCILCTRCIRACAEIQGRFVWGLADRNDDSRIVAGADTTMLEARCESCGACAAFCPTGALDDKMSVGLGQPDKVVTTICTFCGVGCSLDLNVRENRITRVTSRAEAPVNGMSLCVKGRYGYDFVHHPDRLTKPRVRRYLLEGKSRTGGRGEWVEVSWDTALDLTARRLVALKRASGADAIGVLASAKCTNEENYLMQKFARQVIGTHNVDHCARLCHSSTVAGLAMCYGSGAMSNTMKDVAEASQAILIVGSNITEQHPVFGAMIRQAVLKRGVKLVVADPRNIDITEFATLHLRQRPGTDVALLNGIMHIVVENGWHDQAFIDARCEGYQEFRRTIERYTPEIASEISGVPAEQLYQAAEILALNRPMAVVWAMGITQHTTGISNVLSLGNLQMLLGNMGVPGGGVNPLRGQNNVQGACDMGALVNVFPGYQAVSDPKARRKFSQAWALGSANNMAVESVLFGDQPGLTLTEMVAEAGSGRIRGLYILGEDPMLTDPDLNHMRQCLDACEFTVLQEIFASETSALADVLLPGGSFAEKEGTFTNTDRRIQHVRAAVDAPGEARADWAIIADVARRMLAMEQRPPIGAYARWDYASPAQIMGEIAELNPSHAGASHARLDRGDQLFWPVLGPEHPGTPILHVGQFVRGKGRFHAIDHLPAAELPDEDYPILLTTGRVLYHWHAGEITRRSARLLEMYPETLVEISPDDATRIGLNGNHMVRVRSRRGEMIARALVTDRVTAGVIFGNCHFPGPQNVNNLTICALDPIAKMPEYKVCAVRVEAIEEQELLP
jgi:formate dehydrogenase alpha subunit